MQSFKRNLLQHHLAVGYWMQTHQAGGGMDPVSLTLEIEHASRRIRFTPQFVMEDAEGGLGYTPQLQSGVSGFVGWLPYFNKRWPQATDKLAFKAFADAQGLRTPAWGGPLAAPPAQNYVVKASRSTFGRGMRGPYVPTPPKQLADGEYWEAFVTGRIVKAWFWDGELAVVEIIPPPTLVGDGHSSVARLLALHQGAQALRQPPPPELLTLQGMSMASVPAPGRRVQVDYRYISSLNPANSVDHNVREAIKGSTAEAQLQAAGRAAWAAMPDDLRPGTAFTLDGVLDEADQLWLLEINCNPQIHPAFYGAMLSALFATDRP